MAWTFWNLGYSDQALKKSDEALALAQKLSHPFSLAAALDFAAILHHLRREGQAAEERAEDAIILSTEQGFPLWAALGTFLRGWALAEQGQAEEGITQMRWAVAAWRATGAEVSQSRYLALLAEAYGKASQPEEGLRVLAEAFAQVDKTGERFYEAELYRLKGELTLQSQASPGQVQTSPNKSKDPDIQLPTPSTLVEVEAEECFWKAIEIAQKQQAKSLKLRATISLARLWQTQGKTTEARDLLAPVYNWFTEGFDTADLQDAKVLLEKLS